MRFGERNIKATALVAPSLLFLAMAVDPTAGHTDEPRGLGRLFRFGGNPPSTAATSSNGPTAASEGKPANLLGASSSPLVSADRASGSNSNAAQSRIIPQPRVTRAVTDADPIVTRVSLARSDDGAQFGMFLQVYADGTVIDGEGVHQVGREGVKPVLDALQASELYRLKGHCGSPPTDFVEQVQMVVYERSLGRLRANAFSFSGNPQGCDHSVRHLQTVLDALQTKLSRPVMGPGLSSSRPGLTSSSSPIQLNDGQGGGSR
jgi:hypothetical protein